MHRSSRYPAVVTLFLLASNWVVANPSDESDFKRFFVSFNVGYLTSYAPIYDANVEIPPRVDAGQRTPKLWLGCGLRLTTRWSVELSHSGMPLATKHAPAVDPRIRFSTGYQSSKTKLGVDYRVPFQRWQFIAGGGLVRLSAKTEYRELNLTNQQTNIEPLKTIDNFEATEPFFAVGLKLYEWRRIEWVIRLTGIVTNEDRVKDKNDISLTTKVSF